MSGSRDGTARLHELCEEIMRRGDADPEELERLTAGVERLLAPRRRRTGGGRKNRRPRPVIDPFEVYRADPDTLASRLRRLDLEQLRDVVAHHGMDPRRLVMKWKDRDRVIAHIVETVEVRSRKGEVFRGSSRPAE